MDRAQGPAPADLLRAGVDDCVDPSYSAEEVAVRTAVALVLRTEGNVAPVRLGHLVIDRVVRSAVIDSVPLDLSRTQMCVLDHLVAHRHRLVTGEELLEHCWNADRDPFGDPLPSQLTRLRARLAGAVTIRWSTMGGYRIEVPTP